MSKFVVVLGLAAVGTWAQRVLPWVFAVRAQSKERAALDALEPFLHAFAPAILAALLLSSLWAPGFFRTWRLLAVLGGSGAAVFAACRFRTIGAGVLAGMAIYWALRVH